MSPAFRASDEAVSPVIGTILMVAITVVLAAVVFIVVTQINKGGEPAPEFVVATSSSSHSAQVVGAQPGLDWFRDLKVGGTCAASARLNGAPLPTVVGTAVRPGDTLSGCNAGQTLTVTALKPNQLLYQTTFS